ncbi:MAG TPA: hypothetical protein VNC39_01570 [Acidocella sp.]|jgi:hypothetical protein|uniref:hypothetical protein n=1 Tax=Acidocella sp. TaxID=50710 RepID=UPI002CF6E77A|nr:hypothetical protein [Acidocella sp.]HVE20639.1 hypothetical protein [Acidocella sp.]
MARKCASAAILDTLRDPRVVTLAPTAQLVWIRIVTAMQNSDISVLRFGSDIMNQTEIALFIQIAETEIETHLKTIIDRGLLAREGDGAIGCPMLQKAKTRSEINRINGSSGGRPRKDGTPPQRQQSLLLPIPGGDGKTKKTESETEMPTDAAKTPTYLLKESSNEVKVSTVSQAEFAEVGYAVLDAMGIDQAKTFVNFGIVRQWLADGADKAMILDVVTRKMRPGVTTPNYFSKAIAEAIAARPAKKPEWERQYDAAMADWELCGRGFAPMPNLRDFKPAEVA